MKNPGAPEVDVGDSEQPPDVEVDCSDMLSTKRLLTFWVTTSIVFFDFFRFPRLLQPRFHYVRGSGWTARARNMRFHGCFDPVVLT